MMKLEKNNLKKIRSWLTRVNPLTPWPGTHDWDNLVEKKVKKKPRRPIPKKLNIEGWNWKKNLKRT
jgi:hypothetical protein